MGRYESASDRGVTRRTVLGALGGAAVAGCIDVGSGGDGVDLTIEATERQLFDEAPSIVVEGADGPVTIRTSATDASGVEWHAEATFTPEDGRVDVSRQAPEGSAYDRVDPRGLIWSMESRELGATAYDMDQAIHRVEVEAWPGEEPGSGDVPASAEMERVLQRESVTEEVPDGPVYGSLFRPTDSEPASGIVLLHGSAGNVPRGAGRLLASRGYAVLALQYFSPDVDALPDALVEVPVEYVERSIRWLQERPYVTDDPIGINGISRGGELAMFVASRMDGIGAVVNLLGSGVLWPAQASNSDPETSAWSLDGEPLPHIDRSPRDVLEAEPPELEDASVDLESIDCPILLISGQEDRVWPSHVLLDRTARRLEEIDFEHGWAHHSYEDAGHNIGIPGVPTTFARTRGGTPAGVAAACEDFWPRALEYFDVDGGE